MLPSPNDLIYFQEVANLLNLSRAAECLGISQPSLTLAMQRLEESLGAALLIRHKRGVTLTQAGKQLLAHLHQLMQQWDTIKSETLASSYEIQGCFTLGCHPLLASCVLPHFLPDLLEKYPKLEIKLKHEQSRKITEQVINLGIDVAIVVNPARHPDLIINKLDNYKTTLWQGKVERKIQSLDSGEAVLIGDPDLVPTQIILKQLKKQNITYSYLLATNNLEVAAALTEKGSGIGILPDCIAQTKNLEPIANSPFHMDEIYVIYRGENRHIKAIQVIADAIKVSRTEVR